MDRSNGLPFGQPEFLLSEADLQMLGITLQEKEHDKAYKESMRLIITLIESYVRFGVHHSNFRGESDCIIGSTFTGVDVLIAAIESNQTTVANWLTSHIKDHGVYRQAIMAIVKSQHEESEIMFSQVLKQGSLLKMICPGLVTDSLWTIVDHASSHTKEITKSAVPDEKKARMMCVTEHLAIKKLEFLFSHSVEPFGWPGYLIGLVADDEKLHHLPNYLEVTYLDLNGEGRCYILP